MTDTLHTRLLAAVQQRMDVRLCIVEGCGKVLRRTGRACSMHSSRHSKTGSYGPPGPMVRSAEERFWSRVDKSGDCWDWLGSVSSTGYGMINADGRRFATHRYSYELANGVSPGDQQVMHSCDNRRCVRPDHLSLGNHVANAADMMRRQRHGSAMGPTVLRAVQLLREHDFTFPQIAEVTGYSVGGLKHAMARNAAAYGVDVDGG